MRLPRAISKSAAGAALFLLPALVLPYPDAAAAVEPERELTFASGLVDMGFVDYAEKVLAELLREHPDMKKRATPIRVNILMMRGRNEEAEKLVNALPKNDPMKAEVGLALANRYYMVGEVDKAKAIYTAYFKRHSRPPKNKSSLRFYRDAAYTFSQIQEKAGDAKGAVRALGFVLDSKPEKFITRRIKSEQSVMALKVAKAASGQERRKYLDIVHKNVKYLRWGGLDLWHGQAITQEANAYLIEGKKDKAEEALRDNLDILKEIDQMLVESGFPRRESPMAMARYLLAALYRAEGERLVKTKKKRAAGLKKLKAALNHYYNVYLKYPDSDVGPKAGESAQKLIEKLEELTGKKLKIPPVDLSKVAEAHFEQAHELYKEKKYREAADKYFELLNQFPETSVTPLALGNLMVSLANLNSDLYLDAVLSYTAERLAGDEAAAGSVLRVAKHYHDAGRMKRYAEVCDYFVKAFPKHEHAGMVLYSLAEQRRKAGDEAGARALYLKIKEAYPKDKYYPKALSSIGWAHYRQEQYKEALPWFDLALNATAPGPDKARAKLFEAHTYRQMDQWDKALAAYGQLDQWLSPKDNAYLGAASEAKERARLLSFAVFYSGHCYSQLGGDAEAAAAARRKAVKAYRRLVREFPKSALAPRALSSLGALYMGMGKSDEAAAAFQELADKYPDSEAGKDAAFAMVSALVELKKYDEARAKSEEMIANPGAYRPDQLVRIGQLMLDERQYETAAKAFEQVKKRADDRESLERAFYGLGVSYFELKKYDEAIKNLEDLLLRYEKSGLFFEAKFLLGRAYKQQKRFPDAMIALREVFLKASDQPELWLKANMDLGEVYEAKGEGLEALSSYSRVALLGNADDAQMRAVVENATLRAIRLAKNLGRWQDAFDMCEQYLETFPRGDHVVQCRDWKAEIRANLIGATAPEQGGATQ